MCHVSILFVTKLSKILHLPTDTKCQHHNLKYINFHTCDMITEPLNLDMQTENLQSAELAVGMCFGGEVHTVCCYNVQVLKQDQIRPLTPAKLV